MAHIEPQYMVVVHYPIRDEEAATRPESAYPSDCRAKARFVTLARARAFAASLNRQLKSPAYAAVVDLYTNAQINV
jgi:hypothetical protein